MDGTSNCLAAFHSLTKRCELIHTKSANEERIAVALAATKTPAAKLVRPIIIIGAGGITRDAHLPAYQKAGFPVCALVDVDRQKAENLAAGFHVPFATNSLEEALKASPQCVFDLAVPASALLS